MSTTRTINTPRSGDRRVQPEPGPSLLHSPVPSALRPSLFKPRLSASPALFGLATPTTALSYVATESATLLDGRQTPFKTPASLPSSKRNPFHRLSGSAFDDFVLNVTDKIRHALEPPSPPPQPSPLGRQKNALEADAEDVDKKVADVFGTVRDIAVQQRSGDEQDVDFKTSAHSTAPLEEQSTASQQALFAPSSDIDVTRSPSPSLSASIADHLARDGIDDAPDNDISYESIDAEHTVEPLRDTGEESGEVDGEFLDSPEPHDQMEDEVGTYEDRAHEDDLQVSEQEIGGFLSELAKAAATGDGSIEAESVDGTFRHDSDEEQIQDGPDAEHQYGDADEPMDGQRAEADNLSEEHTPSAGNEGAQHDVDMIELSSSLDGEANDGVDELGSDDQQSPSDFEAVVEHVEQIEALSEVQADKGEEAHSDREGPESVPAQSEEKDIGTRIPYHLKGKQRADTPPEDDFVPEEASNDVLLLGSSDDGAGDSIERQSFASQDLEDDSAIFTREYLEMCSLDDLKMILGVIVGQLNEMDDERVEQGWIDEALDRFSLVKGWYKLRLAEAGEEVSSSENEMDEEDVVEDDDAPRTRTVIFDPTVESSPDAEQQAELPNELNQNLAEGRGSPSAAIQISIDAPQDEDLVVGQPASASFLDAAFDQAPTPGAQPAGELGLNELEEDVPGTPASNTILENTEANVMDVSSAAASQAGPVIPDYLANDVLDPPLIEEALANLIAATTGSQDQQTDGLQGGMIQPVSSSTTNLGSAARSALDAATAEVLANFDVTLPPSLPGLNIAHLFASHTPAHTTLSQNPAANDSDANTPEPAVSHFDQDLDLGAAREGSQDDKAVHLDREPQVSVATETEVFAEAPSAPDEIERTQRELSDAPIELEAVSEGSQHVAAEAKDLDSGDGDVAEKIVIVPSSPPRIHDVIDPGEWTKSTPLRFGPPSSTAAVVDDLSQASDVDLDAAERISSPSIGDRREEAVFDDGSTMREDDSQGDEHIHLVNSGQSIAVETDGEHEDMMQPDEIVSRGASLAPSVTIPDDTDLMVIEDVTDTAIDILEQAQRSGLDVDITTVTASVTEFVEDEITKDIEAVRAKEQQRERYSSPGSGPDSLTVQDAGGAVAGNGDGDDAETMLKSLEPRSDKIDRGDLEAEASSDGPDNAGKLAERETATHLDEFAAAADVATDTKSPTPVDETPEELAAHRQRDIEFGNSLQWQARTPPYIEEDDEPHIDLTGSPELAPPPFPGDPEDFEFDQSIPATVEPHDVPGYVQPVTMNVDAPEATVAPIAADLDVIAPVDEPQESQVDKMPNAPVSESPEASTTPLEEPPEELTTTPQAEPPEISTTPVGEPSSPSYAWPADVKAVEDEQEDQRHGDETKVEARALEAKSPQGPEERVSASSDRDELMEYEEAESPANVKAQDDLRPRQQATLRNADVQSEPTAQMPASPSGSQQADGALSPKPTRSPAKSHATSASPVRRSKRLQPDSEAPEFHDSEEEEDDHEVQDSLVPSAQRRKSVFEHHSHTSGAQVAQVAKLGPGIDPPRSPRKRAATPEVGKSAPRKSARLQDAASSPRQQIHQHGPGHTHRHKRAKPGKGPLTRNNCSNIKLKIRSLDHGGKTYVFSVPSCALNAQMEIGQKAIETWKPEVLGPDDGEQEGQVVGGGGIGGEVALEDDGADVVPDADVRDALRRIAGADLWHEGAIELLEIMPRGRR
ncbi:hypothetical protein OIV83_004193 [Microbotryomycetes sp. JL201]|nr:hypothetical protein OIV83_004193 [Microbotryomycetes sp. JL201]